LRIDSPIYTNNHLDGHLNPNPRRRQGTEGNPFRFFWNQSRAVAPNVYLMLYPREPLASDLAGSPERGAEVLAMLRRLGADRLIAGGRVYGGGLHKLEPRELARLSIPAPWPVANGEFLPRERR
jgi:hypothetical protein